MRTFLLSASIVGLGCGSTLAADLPAKIPAIAKAPAAQTFNWDGFYLGGHIGGARSAIDWHDLDDDGALSILNPIYPPLFGFRDSSWVGGGQLGYQRQIDRWVVGVEGSYSRTALISSFDASTVFGGVANDNILTSGIKSVALVTARLGLTHDRWLIYVKAGYARGEILARLEDKSGGIQGSWNSELWHHGWTVGAGTDYRLSSNVSVGVEYNHISLGSRSHSALDSNGVGPISTSVDAVVDTVWVRLNFRLRTP